MKKYASNCLLIVLLISCVPPPESGPKVRYKEDVFSQVVSHKEVPYGKNLNYHNEEVSLNMNIYEPQGDNLAQRPVVIMSHGGYFMYGNKSEYDYLCRSMARLGYVTATIDYRLWPDVENFPKTVEGQAEVVFNALSDLKAAIRFFRKDADTINKYRIDPNKIIVGGFSAGGTMALYQAFADETDNFPPEVVQVIESIGGINGNSGNPGYESNSLLSLNFSGNMLDDSIIDSDDSPIFSHHGTNDNKAPIGRGRVTYPDGSEADFDVIGADVIHQKMKEEGIEESFYRANGIGHTSEMNDAATQQAINFVYDLIN